MFFLFITLGMMISPFSFAQTTVEKRSYWDAWSVSVQRIWHELGDGTWHGDAEFYKENGSLWYRSKMNYGAIEHKIWFFQDGSINVEMNQDKDGEYNGVQEVYYFYKGKRFLGQHAEISNGVVNIYRSYFLENGALQFNYTVNGNVSTFKRYDEGGDLLVEVEVENGDVSGMEEYYGITIKNNRIEKVDISNVQGTIVDGRYYSVIKPSYDPKIMAYYKIPTNLTYLLKAKLIYDDSWTVRTGKLDFGLDLTLRGDFNADKYFEIRLNSLEYDDGNKWEYSSNAMASFFMGLIPDGLYQSYDTNTKNAYQINYNNGVEIWKKEFYRDGTLRMLTKGVVVKKYNKQGILYSMTDGEKVYIYNNVGDVIDSNEIREEYSNVNNKYLELGERYKLVNDKTNLIIKDDFCVDIESGVFTSECFTKENRYMKLLRFCILIILLLGRQLLNPYGSHLRSTQKAQLIGIKLVSL